MPLELSTRFFQLITKFSFKFSFKEKTNYFNMKAREKLFIGIALKTLYKSTRKMRSWIFDNTHDLCISRNLNYQLVVKIKQVLKGALK